MASCAAQTYNALFPFLSYAFFLTRLSSNSFFQWDSLLKSVSSQCSLKQRWQIRTKPCSCAKADVAHSFPRIMWFWLKTRPFPLETGSDKMNVSKALKIQVPMGWQPKLPGIYFTYIWDDWSFWLKYDKESYSYLSKAWDIIRWKNQIF